MSEGEDVNARYYLREDAIHEEFEKDYFRKCAYLGLTLEEAMEAGSLEGITQAMNYSESTKGLSSIYNDDIGVQKLYVASFIDSLVRGALERGLSSEKGITLKREFFLKISHCTQTEQLSSYAINAARKLIEILNLSDYKKYSYIVSLAMKFINTNRYKKILPRDVAEEIKVNRTYLSNQFTKEVGMTLTDYIQQVKINMARHYLDSHIYKPSEISDLLHFSCYSYFCKVFKKHTGSSPSKYQFNQTFR